MLSGCQYTRAPSSPRVFPDAADDVQRVTSNIVQQQDRIVAIVAAG
jgi:hypothetical protein